jgi:hypothetical protein
MSSAEATGADALRVRLRLWHPDCWVLDVTDRAAVGLRGYGVFTRPDGRGTTRYTLYGDDRAAVEAGLSAIRDQPAVYDAVPMTGGYQERSGASPGTVTRELLVEHDAETQIADALTSRGFVYAAPCDTRGNEERWTLYVNAGRDAVRSRLDEVRAERDAAITVESVTALDRGSAEDPLPTDRLSARQREVFQLARRRGYYRHPTETSAAELAAELGITTSTIHEHLHRAEEKLLDLS